MWLYLFLVKINLKYIYCVTSIKTRKSFLWTKKPRENIKFEALAVIIKRGMFTPYRKVISLNLNPYLNFLNAFNAYYLL
jgi:hypothetical protein